MILPNEIQPDDKLVYTHIPKAAGTSVNHYFRHLLGRENVGWLDIDFSREDLKSGNGFDRYKVIGGHFTRTEAAPIPGPAIYLASLRDPVERIVSHHGYTLKLPEGQRPPMTGDLLTDLRGPFGRHMLNQQCKYVGREPTAHSAFEALADGRTGLARIDEVTPFLHAITTAMGLQPIEVPVENVGSRNAVVVTAEVRAVIEDMAAEDIKLYGALSAGRAPSRDALGPDSVTPDS